MAMTSPCPKCGQQVSQSPGLMLQHWQDDCGKKREPAAEKSCIWTEDDEGNWVTTCDEYFLFIAGNPLENNFRFCPYCGKPLNLK